MATSTLDNSFLKLKELSTLPDHLLNVGIKWKGASSGKRKQWWIENNNLKVFRGVSLLLKVIGYILTYFKRRLELLILQPRQTSALSQKTSSYFVVSQPSLKDFRGQRRIREA